MIRAKFFCQSVTQLDGEREQANLTAVSGKANELDENSKFNKATPSAKLEIFIDNPGTQGFFKPGAEYYADFTVAPEEGKEPA